MNMIIRPALAADAEKCGRIMYTAFKDIAERHGFPPDFPSETAGKELATGFIAHPAIFAIVAEVDGAVVGSNFLGEGDPIRGVGFLSIRNAIGVRSVRPSFRIRL